MERERESEGGREGERGGREGGRGSKRKRVNIVPSPKRS